MKNIVVAQDAPKAIGPYSHAVKACNIVFVSGQLGTDAVTGDFASDEVEGQARQALKNLGKVLSAAGMNYSNVTKTTVFLKNFDDFAKVNAIYAEFFTTDYPARSCVEVSRLPKDALIEIEAIAVH